MRPLGSGGLRLYSVEDFKLTSEKFFTFPEEYTSASAELANQWLNHPEYFYSYTWMCYVRAVNESIFQACVTYHIFPVTYNIILIIFHSKNNCS